MSLHRVGAVGLVDPHRPRGADAVGVQEQHDLADHLLLGPAGDDPRRPLGADAGHLAQPLRAACSISSNTASPKARTSLLRVDRADAADHAGAEILLDALERGRRARLQEGGPELQAMRAVVDPAAAQSGRTRRPRSIAAWPTTVIRSRCPRALTRSTQKPFSALWKVTRSTSPAKASVGGPRPAVDGTAGGAWVRRPSRQSPAPPGHGWAAAWSRPHYGRWPIELAARRRAGPAAVKNDARDQASRWIGGFTPGCLEPRATAGADSGVRPPRQADGPHELRCFQHVDGDAAVGGQGRQRLRFTLLGRRIIRRRLGQGDIQQRDHSIEALLFGRAPISSGAARGAFAGRPAGGTPVLGRGCGWRCCLGAAFGTRAGRGVALPAEPPGLLPDGALVHRMGPGQVSHRGAGMKCGPDGVPFSGGKNHGDQSLDGTRCAAARSYRGPARPLTVRRRGHRLAASAAGPTAADNDSEGGGISEAGGI